MNSLTRGMLCVRASRPSGLIPWGRELSDNNASPSCPSRSARSTLLRLRNRASGDVAGWGRIWTPWALTLAVKFGGFASSLISSGTMVKSCVWLCLWLCALPVRALDPQKAITQLVHTSWTEREGAPGSIRALAQTTDGYLWLSTASGLYRFDGARFTRFEPAAGEELPGTSLGMLCATRDGSLWIASASGRISRLHNGHVKTYSPPDGPSRTHSLAEDSHGVLLAGTDTGLASFEDGHWKDAGKEWGIPARLVQSVYIDARDTMWVATQDRILCLLAGQKHVKETGEEIGQISSFAQAPDGAIWVAEVTRSARVIRTGRSHDRMPLAEVAVGASSVLFDRQGSLWISSIGDGLRRIPYPGRVSGQHIAQFGPQPEQFTKKDGLSHDFVTSALEDREGNMWFGTAGGLDRFRESKVTPVSIPDGDQPRCLLASRDGSIWTGALNRSLLQIGPDGRSKVRAGTTRTTALLEDRAGSLWLANTYGVVGRLVGNSVEYLHLPPHSVWSITMDHAGGLWILDDDKGVFRFADGELTSFADVTELPHQPGFIYADRSGRLWFGYANGRATVYQHGHFHGFGARDGLAVGRILSIVDDRANRVWVGGEGLCKFENGRFQCLNRQTGLPMSRVAGIAEDEDGYLWFGGETGAVRIHPDAFDHAVTDPAHRLSYDFYNLLDGLPGGLQLTYPFPKVVRGRDGRIWFATNSGLAFIDPRRIPKNPLPPPVHVEALKVDGKTIPPADGVVLAPHTHSIEINYTALSLSIPERVLFRYELEGAESEWQEVGTRRQAFYTNLPPKQYRFRVIACNNDGVWNDSGTSLDFFVGPAYYQTIWFRSLSVLATMLGLWGILRLRIRQTVAKVQAQFRERMLERERIAGDLHDTLLQGYLSASLHAHAAFGRLAEDSPAKQPLGRALELIGKASEESRMALRGIRSSQLGDLELGQALSRVPQELAAPADVGFRVRVEGRPRSLRPVLLDDVYRIGREAIVNTFQHAGATNIEVEVEYAANRLRMLVQDNGCGIDAQTLQSGKAGHWGLKGMRERAERIGGKLNLFSNPGAGTQVVLTVAAQLAFEPEDVGKRRGWVHRLFRPYSGHSEQAKMEDRDERASSHQNTQR